jgi:phenylalanine ammonia-lyase
MLIASYLYILCQALDLRALQLELLAGLDKIVHEELDHNFGFALSASQLVSLACEVCKVISDTYESTSTMDAAGHMEQVANSSMASLVKFFTSPNISSPSIAGSILTTIPAFCSRVASRGVTLIDDLRREYLFGKKGPAPASVRLNKTRPVYEFVRLTLRIPMHGAENYARFENESDVVENNIGQNISLIHEVSFILFFILHPLFVVIPIGPDSHFALGDSQRGDARSRSWFVRLKAGVVYHLYLTLGAVRTFPKP